MILSQSDEDYEIWARRKRGQAVFLEGLNRIDNYDRRAIDERDGSVKK